MTIHAEVAVLLFTVGADAAMDKLKLKVWFS